MSDLNRVHLIGRLGRDAVLKYTPSGMAVANFALATDCTYKDTEKTLWTDVSVFGKAAESLKPYLVKGKQVLVEGRLDECHAWTGQDGKPRASLRVVSERLQLLGGGERGEREENAPTAAERTSGTAGAAERDDSDSLPF